MWGIMNQKFEVKACHRFIKEYYHDWFPELPSYQAFNSRICYLCDAFKLLASIMICRNGLDPDHSDYLIDSIPVVVAGGKRSGRAKTASELCRKGYCASKGMYYYGIKLHTFAQCNYKAMPTPTMMMISSASEHDLPVAKEMLDDVRDIRLFGDTAFADRDWRKRMLAENNVEIITPIKRSKGQKYLPFWHKLYSFAVSSVKQAIESWNNWLSAKTNIQHASKVRSAAGLTAFIFTRIACACYCFNP